MKDVITFGAFLALSLIAIIIAIYVLSATLLGRAKTLLKTQLGKEDQQHIIDTRKRIESLTLELQKTQPTGTIGDQLKKQINDLNAKEDEYKSSLRKIERSFRPLALNWGVLFPSSILLLALIFISLAAYGNSVSWTTIAQLIVFILGILCEFSAIAFIVFSLRLIEKVAVSSDELLLKMTVDAFKIAQKDMRNEETPFVAINITDPTFPLDVQAGSTFSIKGYIELLNGPSANSFYLHCGIPMDFEYDPPKDFSINTNYNASTPFKNKVLLQNLTLVPNNSMGFSVSIKAPTKKQQYKIYFAPAGSGMTQPWVFLNITTI